MGEIFNNLSSVYEIWETKDLYLIYKSLDRRIVGYFDDNYFQRIIRYHEFKNNADTFKLNFKDVTCISNTTTN